MKIFLYILKEYFKYIIGNISLTVFLFVLFDFIHKTTKYFPEYQPKTEYILRFYLVQIPGHLVQALPIASLLASVISMVLLSRTNEITAMRAAGMGPLQLGAPLAVGGLLLSLTSLFTSEFILPGLAQKTRFIQDVLIEGRNQDRNGQNVRWMRDGQNLFSFREFDAVDQRLWGVSIIELRPNFKPIKTTESEMATYQADTKKWRLAGVRTAYFRKNGALDFVEPKPFLDVVLPFEPKKLKKDDRRPSELAFRELRDAIDRGERSGIDTISLKVELQGKLAYPFAAFVMSLIGLKFGYKSERVTETAKGVLIAFFIGISYWFVLSAGRAMGLRGDLSPVLSAWLPNVVVLVFVLFDSYVGRKANT